MNTKQKLIKHIEQLRACRSCPQMNPPVVSGGPVVSRVVLVGQAPGDKEPKLGRPFAWTAGKTLFQWFKEGTGLDEAQFRTSIYMAAVCRCFPGKEPKGGDRAPNPQEVKNCSRWFKSELDILKPDLVIPVGKLAIQQFLQFDKLVDVIGKQYKSTYEGHAFDVIPLPHPSGASPWHRMEPGKSLIKQALKQINKHPAFKALSLFMLLVIFGQSAQAQTTFKHIPMQYIVALGDPAANSGKGAETWGLWRQDPGPRGCMLEDYKQLKAAGGVAPAQWKFDNKDWWLEEHGAIMEKPNFPLPPGQYVVTGGREVTSVLTIYPRDKDGAERWELANGVKLYDVTHLPCHAARYTPIHNDSACSPEMAPKSVFPVAPGVSMPSIKGCHKQDYEVLFVIGVAV